MGSIRKLPPWLKRRISASDTYNQTNKVISDLGLNTICTHANCPNMGECWACGTATVLILGNICTRNCKFCSVASGKPEAPDVTEPGRVAKMAEEMKLKYLVLTSVDRDDLEDGGAGHFRDVIEATRNVVDGIRFELLTPDFKGSEELAINILSDALPFVFGHNIETVPSLYATARPGGDYMRSLSLLRRVKEEWPDIPTKSSMMLGLGESDAEILSTLKDLRLHLVDRVAIGQYLRPNESSLEVQEYVTPEKFDYWAGVAKDIGFSWVMSSPYTRSSYHAERDES